jgi:hypothetical protein
MHIERFFVPGLAHASYLVVSGSEAVVVDPERNVEGYIAYLAKNELKLVGMQIGARDILPCLKSSDRSVILDVRSAQEWGQDHLDRALNIPLPHLPKHIGGHLALCGRRISATLRRGVEMPPRGPAGGR